MLIIHRQFRGFCERRPVLKGLLDTHIGIGLRVTTTFACIIVSMAFAQPSLGTSLSVVEKMFIVSPGLRLPWDQNRLWWTIILVGFTQVASAWGLWKWLNWRLPGTVVGTVCAAIFVAAQVLSTDATLAFVYFQF